MPVDYSKWDALELSDDSDIEVHPNVDKRSFIRAKQNQIHQQRSDRRHRIVQLKVERVINDGLLVRIDALLAQLEAHSKHAEAASEAGDFDEILFDALTTVTADDSLGPDKPWSPSDDAKTIASKLNVTTEINVSQLPDISFSKVLAALADRVKLEVDKEGSGKPSGSSAGYIAGLKQEKAKVEGAQKDLNVELSKLEKEEGSKITSESIQTGFDSSFVFKAAQAPAAIAVQSKPNSTKSAQPELLNPSRTSLSGAQSAGSEADIEDEAPGSIPAAGGEDDESEEFEASPLAKRFGAIATGDYDASLRFLGAHPEILSERDTDGLLGEAFNAQFGAKSPSDEAYARQCVHQALLLQYCRQLGRDGVALFFARVRSPNHQANRLFADDVNATYARIRSRTAELRRNQESDEAGAGTEQIQLHAVTPGSTINILTPPEPAACQTDAEREGRAVFDSFPPGLRRALQSGSLDRVNEVLGKMSVDEAEAVVQQLGDFGMLSLEEGVIDATTDEGRRQVEELERSGQVPGQSGRGGVEGEEVEDPGMD